jgi:hypothetical protein
LVVELDRFDLCRRPKNGCEPAGPATVLKRPTARRLVLLNSHFDLLARTGTSTGPGQNEKVAFAFRACYMRWAVALTLCAAASASPQAGQDVSLPQASPAAQAESTLAHAQTHFYNARYAAAAELALALRSADTADLVNHELRSSALLFQLKRLLEPPGEKHTTSEKRDKERALKNCAPCPELMTEFFKDIAEGQTAAREMLRVNPRDTVALFHLGKLDLNYVWLQLGPLGRKTGWDEYWEARRSLDAVLKQEPRHVRALVARAWIDYIVDTKMPWGTRWVLGGGSRKRALAAVRDAASIDTEFFSHTEAEFALWDMQVRERALVQATDVARRLAANFPDNREVAAFLAERDASASR